MFKKALATILDILFPVSCVLCKTTGTMLCGSCLESITISPTCIQKPSSNLDSISICTNYEDPKVQKLITCFKFNGLRDLAKPLTTILIHGLAAEILAQKMTLIAIPLHRRREKNRGFNQSALLAHEVSLRMGLPVDTGLKRLYARRPQHTLNRTERLQNLQGVFAYSNDTAPEKVLLIDDIATTYSTLDAAAEELKKHGTKIVTALVVAKNNP